MYAPAQEGERSEHDGGRDEGAGSPGACRTLSVAEDCPHLFHVKPASRDREHGGVFDMRLAASLACSCVARALVSPARDGVMRSTLGGGCIWVGWEARDEGPEDELGLRRKFRVTERWYAWRSTWAGILRQAYHPWGGGM